MPQHAHLDDHAIASIATYIRGNFGNSAKSINASTVQKVRAASVARKIKIAPSHQCSTHVGRVTI